MDQAQEQGAPRAKLLDRLHLAGLVGIGVLMLLRLLQLDADFPIAMDDRLARDGVLYTDEGWYANNAMAFFRHGGWHNAHDMNFAIVLPVQQVLHLFWFAVMGVTIEAARMTSVLASWGCVVLVWAITRRFHGRWPALFAAFLVAGNFHFYAHSRLALAEPLMTFWILLAFWAAAKSADGRPWAWSMAAGAAMLLAMLTKTTALPAAGLLLPALLWAGWRHDKGRWLRPAAAGAVIAAPYLAHRVLMARLFPDDTAFFNAINVGMQLSLNPFTWWEMVELTFLRLRILHRSGFYFFRYGIVLLLFLVPAFRRSPVVALSGLFCVGYISMFGFYTKAEPRYWVPYTPALAMIVAAALHALWTVRDRAKVLRPAWVLVLLLFVAGSVEQLVDIAKMHARPEFTFRDTAREIARIIDDEGGAAAEERARPVLMGHNAYTFALFIDVHPVNDLYAPADIEVLLDHYRPRFLITEDHLTPTRRRFWDHNMPDPRDVWRRYDVMTRRFDVQPIRSFPMLANYRDWDIHLYRLVERDEPLAEAPPIDFDNPL